MIVIDNKKLSLKQKKFCEYYVATGNITQSGLKAGYSLKYMDKEGYKFLGNIGIKEYIEELNKKQQNERIATGIEIKEYLTAVLRGEAKEEVVMSESDGKGGTKSTIILKGANIKDRLKATELLAKILNMFSDNAKIEFENSNIIITGELGLED